jgi:hypothetical protein
MARTLNNLTTADLADVNSANEFTRI